MPADQAPDAYELRKSGLTDTSPAHEDVELDLAEMEKLFLSLG